MCWLLIKLAAGLLLVAQQGGNLSVFLIHYIHPSLTFSVCLTTLYWSITFSVFWIHYSHPLLFSSAFWLHYIHLSAFSDIWLHSIVLWLLLMVIFTFNLPRLQISFREIVNLRICQKCAAWEFVTEFPSSSKSLSHRPGALLARPTLMTCQQIYCYHHQRIFNFYKLYRDCNNDITGTS